MQLQADIRLTGPEDTLRAVDNLNIGPSDWSVDGRWIAVAQITGGANWDIDLLQAKEKGEPVPIAHDKAAEWQPRFSPDGKWLAYTSHESGKNEVYVQTLPPSGQKWTISTRCPP